MDILTQSLLAYSQVKPCRALPITFGGLVFRRDVIVQLDDADNNTYMQGEIPPCEFSRPEVAKVLIEAMHQPVA